MGQQTLPAAEPGLFINVNVSAKQLERPDFCRVVLELLDKTEFPVRHLCLEITERCRSLPVSVINERMAVLRGYGIKFAMDDFGTGSSSSAMALEMLIDEIKIDMSFIRKILVNKRIRRLSRAWWILPMQSISRVVWRAWKIRH